MMLYVPKYKPGYYTSTDIKKMINSNFNKIPLSSYKNERTLKNKFKDQLSGYINLIDLKNLLFFKPSQANIDDNYHLDIYEIESLAKIFDGENTKSISLADAINIHYKMNPFLLKNYKYNFFYPTDLYNPNVGFILTMFQIIFDNSGHMLDYNNYMSLKDDSDMKSDENVKSLIYIKNTEIYDYYKEYNINYTNSMLDTTDSITLADKSSTGVYANTIYSASTSISHDYDLVINSHLLSFNKNYKNVVKKWQEFNGFSYNAMYNKYSAVNSNSNVKTTPIKVEPELIRLLLINNNLVLAFSGFIFIIPEFDVVAKNIDQKTNKPVDIIYGKFDVKNIFIDTKATGYVLSYFRNIYKYAQNIIVT